MVVEELAGILAWEFFEAWGINHGTSPRKVWAQLAPKCREPFRRQAVSVLRPFSKEESLLPQP